MFYTGPIKLTHRPSLSDRHQHPNLQPPPPLRLGSRRKLRLQALPRPGLQTSRLRRFLRDPKQKGTQRADQIAAGQTSAAEKKGGGGGVTAAGRQRSEAEIDGGEEEEGGGRGGGGESEEEGIDGHDCNDFFGDGGRG